MRETPCKIHFNDFLFNFKVIINISILSSFEAPKKGSWYFHESLVILSIYGNFTNFLSIFTDFFDNITNFLAKLMKIGKIAKGS